MAVAGLVAVAPPCVQPTADAPIAYVLLVNGELLVGTIRRQRDTIVILRPPRERRARRELIFGPRLRPRYTQSQPDRRPLVTVVVAAAARKEDRRGRSGFH